MRKYTNNICFSVERYACQRDGVGGALVGSIALGYNLHVPPCSGPAQVAQHLQALETPDPSNPKAPRAPRSLNRAQYN